MTAWRELLVVVTVAALTTLSGCREESGVHSDPVDERPDQTTMGAEPSQQAPGPLGGGENARAPNTAAPAGLQSDAATRSDATSSSGTGGSGLTGVGAAEQMDSNSAQGEAAPPEQGRQSPEPAERR